MTKMRLKSAEKERDHCHDECQLDEASQVGQSDAAKYPPSTGAINSGRLLETRIQGRKTGEKEHRVVPIIVKTNVMPSAMSASDS